MGRRYLVRQTKDGSWVFGPEDAPILAFATRGEAVLAAAKFVMQRPEIELLVDDTPRATPGRRASGRRDDA